MRMNFWMISAAGVVAVMAGYAAYLWWKVYRQQQQVKQTQAVQRAKLAQSIDIIAMALVQGQCNLSEGVLRLKPLSESVGLDFSHYPAMSQLHEAVADMPILAERQQLKRNERMKLDLIRESREADLERDIMAEAVSIRQTVQKWLPPQT